MTDTDVHGPIDFAIIELPPHSNGQAMAAELVNLVGQGTVRLYDFLVVRKDDDGSFSQVDLDDVTDGPLQELRPFAGARSGLLSDDDLPAIADVLEGGSVGVVLLYENAWAIPFVAAARAEGAELVASARFNAQEIMDALDEVEAAD